MRRSLGAFLAKILLAAMPLIGILALYAYYDPFKVLRGYDCYFQSGKPNYVTPNYGYVAVETFVKKYPQYQYDSFIFGNSRSKFYEIKEWSRHVGSDRCFHFDSAAESVYGVCKKISFLKKHEVKIKNALIVLDHELLAQSGNNTIHLFRQHPALTHESKWKFQLSFLKAYLRYDFLMGYLYFRMTGKVSDYMKKKALLEDTPVNYSARFNEMSFPVVEAAITSDPKAFYEARGWMFYKRDEIDIVAPKTIGERQKKALGFIRRTFLRDHTRYKIVVSPLYDQKQLHPEDRDYLCRLFGKENVNDFSGKNQFTQEIKNYYEVTHYRPHVARMIMEKIYAANELSIRKVLNLKAELEEGGEEDSCGL